MRVCMIAYTFYENDNRVMRYCETLVKRGVSVDVIALRKNGQSCFTKFRGVNIYRIQKRFLKATERRKDVEMIQEYVI